MDANMPYNPPRHVLDIADLFGAEAIAHFDRTDGTTVVVFRDGRKIVYHPPAPSQADAQAKPAPAPSSSPAPAPKPKKKGKAK